MIHIQPRVYPRVLLGKILLPRLPSKAYTFSRPKSAAPKLTSSTAPRARRYSRCGVGTWGGGAAGLDLWEGGCEGGLVRKGNRSHLPHEDFFALQETWGLHFYGQNFEQVGGIDGHGPQDQAS